MNESSKPSSTVSLVLLGLAGAGVGFLLHASTQDHAANAASAATTPSVLPIVVQGQPGSSATPIVLNLTMSDEGADPGTRSTSQAITVDRSQPASVPQQFTTVNVQSAPVTNTTSTSNTTVQDFRVSVDGDNVVVAQDGSIVQVGDNGNLNGNTGDASQGGSIGVDVQDSILATGGSDPATYGQPSASDTSAASSGALATTSVAEWSWTGVSGLDTPTSSPQAPHGAYVNPTVSMSADADIAGYEDHSINVSGSRNIVTYDDSNVFIDRDGQINANTGDTDSSGLNAVDTERSVVMSGSHCDDGCDDESVIAAQHGHVDEADGGDDDDEEDGESDDGDVSDAVETREDADSGHESDVVHPGHGLIIGGDGYDDLAIRLVGNDNVLTYDDGNVVIGGSGDVNAQIGDSDTGGTVAMGTHDSLVRGGVSR